ncbi:rhodanese-like domain-containing protein [Rubrolithibacter danxiaensis]|uniref:rhodanese-like domain-containing protein n=1 Tax=Rubrolithibacter danxiaensis TaxID=3390805 RepID=UPI003BF88DFF
MNISAKELKEKIDLKSKLTILDVREELEYHTFNIGGKNIPLGKLPVVLEDLDYEKSEEIIVVCQRGLRSATAQKILQAAGYVNTKNLQGGLLAYRRTNN